MRKERIKLTDSILEILTKMSEGNPGALNVCMNIIKNGAAIDPQSFCGSIGAILALDTHGIYGHRIWELYKYVCDENLESTLGVLRACQLGQLRETDMLHAIDNRGENIDVAAIVAGVKARLPEFGVK